MRRLNYAVLILSLLLALFGAASAEESNNMLRNGGFEEGAGDLPPGWVKDMWRTDGGESRLSLALEGRDGGRCVLVENVISNDARFVQWVEVEPDTLYRLSGYIRAEGLDPERGAGASLSVIGSMNQFPEVYDTLGQWQFMECFIVTAPGQIRIAVGARVGDYAADNVGKAWFDDLSLEPAEAVPLGAETITLLEYANLLEPEPAKAAAPESEKEPAAFGGWVPGIFLFAMLLVLLWIFYVRGVRKPWLAMGVLLLLAAAVRLYLMAAYPGHSTDMNCFFSWSWHMAEVGPNAFYETVGFCDYPPGYMYLLWITGIIMKALRLGDMSTLGRIVIKLVPMLFDLGTVMLLFGVARKRLSDKTAFLLSALYAASPAVLINSAIWGQVDAVLALGLMITVMLAIEKRWRIALPVYMVTLLMKPQTLMVGPLGLSALILQILAETEEKARRKMLKDVLVGLLYSIVIAAVMLTPFLYGHGNPITWIIERYAGSLGSYQYATLNAMNLFYLLGANWVPLDANFLGLTYGTWGIALMALVVLLTILAYIRRRDAEMLPFFGAMVFIGMYMFGIKMHERYLFPALLLLLYAYIRKPDWRTLLMFVGYSVTLFINCAIVLRDFHLPLGVGFAGGFLAVVNLALMGLGVYVALDREVRPLPTIAWEKRPLDAHLSALKGVTPRPEKMKGLDWALMLSLTFVYAIIAYTGLGDTVAPQTYWQSTPGETSTIVFDLGEEREFTMLYYVGINHQSVDEFTVDFSWDGEHFVDETHARMNEGDCFKWLFLERPVYDNLGNVVEWEETSKLSCNARYVRFTREGPTATLFEVGFRDLDGNLIKIQTIRENNGPILEEHPLADEQHTVPEYPSYMNSAYFDEIYHARTGYEHANALQTFEWTHPPLGKVLMMLSIKVFGMTPFGWRFAGALMGVLMVPAMYFLGLLLFKRTRFAFLAAFLMAFDMMHLTQTRIATIDSFAVLCIILMYYFMFKYMRMSFFRDGFRTLVPLFFSGLFMGLGCAFKWTGLYAGLGLAVLFLLTVVQRFTEWKAGMRSAEPLPDEVSARLSCFGKYLLGTLGACVVFFLIIPGAIYFLSYIPHMAWEGGLTLSNFLSVQQRMFHYHSGLTATHPYQSPWYEWPLILRPMWYYKGDYGIAPGNVSSIMAMGNPAIWWVGAPCMLYLVYEWLKPHVLGKPARDHRPALLLLSFGAQLVPWLFVTRAIFIYHYFGSLPFVMLGIVYAFTRLERAHPEGAKATMIGYMAIVLALFIGFYPIATGAEVSKKWLDAMNWLRNVRLPWWDFGGWLRY